MKYILARWIPIALGVLLVAACQSADEPMEQATATDTADQVDADQEASAHGAAVATFFSVWNGKEYEKLDAVVAPDFRRRGPDQDADGLAEMKEFMRQVHTAYPDFHVEVNESAYEGDIAFTHWTVTGTHSGEGSVPATGKTIEVHGATMLRFADGMITEEMAYYDTAALEAQLGVESVPHAR